LLKEIKLNQIIQAVEGSISLVACVDGSKLCKRVDACVTHNIWEKTMLEFFDSVTLEDMVKMQKKKLFKQKDRMYYIWLKVWGQKEKGENKMTKIVNDVTELIGNTPLIKLNKITKDVEAKIV
jgi:hypothetical protein